MLEFNNFRMVNVMELVSKSHKSHKSQRFQGFKSVVIGRLSALRIFSGPGDSAGSVFLF